MQVLEDVTMELDLADMEDMTICEDMTIPLKRMPHSSAGSTFVVLEREEGSLAAGSAVAVMKFTQKGRDPSTGEVDEEGYEEDYQLEEDVEVRPPFPMRCSQLCWHPETGPGRARGRSCRRSAVEQGHAEPLDELPDCRQGFCLHAVVTACLGRLTFLWMRRGRVRRSLRVWFAAGLAHTSLLCAPLQISATDYIKAVPTANFKAVWDDMGDKCEVSGSYALDAVEGGVPATVEAMITHMGMFVAEGTDLVAPNARSHMIMLSGKLCGGHMALLRISFGLDPSGSMVMKVTTRSVDHAISQVLHEIVQSV